VEWRLIVIFCFLQTYRTDPLQLNAIEQVVEYFIIIFAIVFYVSILLVFPMNKRIEFSFVIFCPFCAMQEGAEELEEPKEVVYIEKKNGPINSSIQQKVNDSEESKIEGYRNNILERNGWCWCTFEILWFT